MIITEQQVFDYIYCPAFFEMRYMRGIALDEQAPASALLEKVSRYLFINLLNNRLCPISEMQKKWDSICKENPYVINNNKKVVDGMASIVKLVNWASQNTPKIMDIDTQYSFLIGQYEFVGNLGIISATPREGYELLVPNFSSRIPTQLQLNSRLKYTMDAYAFRCIYNQDIDGIKAVLVKHGRTMYTRRDIKDFERLTSSLYNIARAIETGIFYPAEGLNCQACVAQEYCRYWYAQLPEEKDS